LALTGVNLAGLEFQGAKLPGRLNVDFVAPSEAELAYYAGRGANLVRAPFLWERLEPNLGEENSPSYQGVLDTLVQQTRDHGLHVVLDAHQYGRRTDNGVVRLIGQDPDTLRHFANFWGRLALRYRDQAHVIFGLVNEPHDEPAALVLASQNAAIAAIRATGARQLILVDGPGWSGAHAWLTSGGDELTAISDPANNYAFDIHQYLDADSSGAHRECVRDASQRLNAFTQWARAHRKRGFLGEFGASADGACLEGLEAMLSFMDANGDVWLGWAYWAGGGWWGPDYPLTLEPTSLQGPDRAQMNVLRRHFAGRS
jgi:endoglucanase